MLTDGIYAVADSIGLNKNGSMIYGNYKGFGVSVKAVEDKNCCVMTAFVRKGALTDRKVEDFLEEYKANNDFVKAIRSEGFIIGIVYSCVSDESGNDTAVQRTLTVIYDTVQFLMMNYYSNVCSKCGSAIGLTFREDKQLCRSCAEAEEREHPTVANENVQSLFGAQNSVQPAVNTESVPVQNNFPSQPEAAEAPQNAAVVGAVAGAAGFGAGAFAMGNATPVQQASDVTAVPTYNNVQENDFSDVVVTPTPDAGRASELMTAPDYMGTVGLDTNPESTGYATHESLAAIPMPERNAGDPMGLLKPQNYNENNMAQAQSPVQPNPNPGYSTPLGVPSNGDFRSDESYYNSQPIYGNVSSRPTRIEPENSNPILGIIGALLFSVLGCAVWIIVGKLGYVSVWCGFLLSFLTILGYKKLGKKFDIFGIICCAIVVILEILGCVVLVDVWSICEDATSMSVANYLGFDGFVDLFFRYFEFVQRFDDAGFVDKFNKVITLSGDLTFNIVISYVAGIGGFIAMLAGERSKNKTR